MAPMPPPLRGSLPRGPLQTTAPPTAGEQPTEARPLQQNCRPKFRRCSTAPSNASSGGSNADVEPTLLSPVLVCHDLLRRSSLKAAMEQQLDFG